MYSEDLDFQSLINNESEFIQKIYKIMTEIFIQKFSSNAILCYA